MLVISDNNLTLEINHRLTTANRCYHGMQKQLRSHFLNKKTKIKLYKTLLWPILLYGSKSWALTKCDENKLRIFERKILRKIYSSTNDNGTWNVRYNHELYQLWGAGHSKSDKSRRIRWLGHLFRSEDMNPCRKLTFTKAGNIRRRGIPSIRWLDSIEQDLQILGTRGWKTKALYRNQWRNIVEAVKACTRL
jgi:hypothetical protein